MTILVALFLFSLSRIFTYFAVMHSMCIYYSIFLTWMLSSENCLARDCYPNAETNCWLVYFKSVQLSRQIHCSLWVCKDSTYQNIKRKTIYFISLPRDLRCDRKPKNSFNIFYITFRNVQGPPPLNPPRYLRC